MTLVERVLAPNPGLYTGPGTNTYLLRNAGEVLILDPGPIIDAHEAAIVAAIGTDRPVGVVAVQGPRGRHARGPGGRRAAGPGAGPRAR